MQVRLGVNVFFIDDIIVVKLVQLVFGCGFMWGVCGQQMGKIDIGGRDGFEFVIVLVVVEIEFVNVSFVDDG